MNKEVINEIDSIEDFESWISSKQIKRKAIQDLILDRYEDKILKHTYKGSLFLGCGLTDISAGHIVKTGGVVISNSDEVKFEVHRSKLYNRFELFNGFDVKKIDSYKDSYDYKIYKEFVNTGKENPESILVSLMRRLHDHSITDALMEAIAGRKVVAIMGGHSLERSEEYYLKVALIARRLTQKGFLMVSGGGPGAMEATHLGAYFSGRSEEELKLAIDEMKIRPFSAVQGKEYNDKDWLNRAWEIIDKYPIIKGKEKESMSIGIPTWLYGHEPPAPFATHIAKYFANSVREDGLLSIAKYGVIFSPGSAGTIQEIFQDATQNHYASDNTDTEIKRYVSPMILFGVKRWTVEKPAWNLIQRVSDGKPYGQLLSLTDNVEDVIESILSYDPDKYSFPRLTT